jgi:hypothetical protein
VRSGRSVLNCWSSVGASSAGAVNIGAAGVVGAVGVVLSAPHAVAMRAMVKTRQVFGIFKREFLDTLFRHERRPAPESAAE